MAPRPGRISSGGGTAPDISPDGRWLAFARQIPDGTLTFKGHKYGPRVALWLRDMKTGAERMIMDPIEPVASPSKTIGVLPRYHWAADGKSIVIFQGGKIRRVDVASGDVATIPFTATVHRTISEMARLQFRIPDDSVKAKFIRWPTATADGRTIAFDAIGRIYVQEGASGKPRRVTAPSFSALEYMPAWSPDGRWISFVTWDDSARGNLWKVAASGGAPVRLTKDEADFVDPVWSPDGRSIVVMRGGATARGGTITHNAWWELVRVSAENADTGVVLGLMTRPSGSSLGGEARRQMGRPSFGPDGRLFFPEEGHAPAGGTGRGGGSALVSISAKGDGDKRVHLTFPTAEEITPSPDGAYVAFQEGDNVYVTPMAWEGTGGAVAGDRQAARTVHCHAADARWR